MKALESPLGASMDLRSRAVESTTLPDGKASSPELAINVWKGIVTGHWSLLDHFQLDGQQYILARRCSGDKPAAHKLSHREREVTADVIRGYSNKAIAFRLGIGEATVATHLRRALSKLGIRSRRELIRLFPKAAFEGVESPLPMKLRGHHGR
jgi:DNA-binding CsgD family transcriptional regulator